MAYNRVYGAGLDVLRGGSGYRRVYGVGLDVLLGNLAIRTYGVGIDVMFRADRNPNGGRQSIAATPGSEDEDMVYTDLIFPECLTYGSTGSPNYETYKTEVDSGAEQRQSRWVYPKHEYNIKMDNLPPDEIATVMNIWHNVSGDYAAFLFLDPLDHTSAADTTAFNKTTVSNTDQQVAVALGTQSAYPLYKYYTIGNRQKQRRIRYPKDGTLVVAIDGHQVYNWTYNYTSCLLQFSVNPSQTGAFSIVGSQLQGISTAGFNVNDLVYLTGFVNAGNNAPSGGSPLRVVSIDSVNSMTLQKYDGTAWGVANETAVAGVTLTPTLPPTGAVITAGFYFYVPVRFKDGTVMVSEITAGMRESTVANFNSIVLTEVFE